MEQCKDCRFMSRAGCRMGTCATVRASMLAVGRPAPKEPVKVSGPEPMGSKGEAGYLLTYNGLTKEYPPTPAGWREAYIDAHTLAAGGTTVSWADMYRDIDRPESA